MYLGTATSIYVWTEKSQVGNHADRTLTNDISCVSLIAII